MSDKSVHRVIVDAYYEAQKRRPYQPNDALVKSVTPGGGDWACVAPEGCITRSVMWNGAEVALMNPKGDLEDIIEGQISMAVRALPVMDNALRAIIVLAESADNLPLIREIAVSVMEFVERPAPRVKEPEDEDGSDAEEEYEP